MNESSIANQSQDNSPVSVEYVNSEGKSVVGQFDLLVVACDPRNLESICNYNSDELDIFSRLKNFEFHTTLLKVGHTEPQPYTVVFAPTNLECMQGSVYAYRNETAKQFGMDAAQKMQENLVTVYQLVDPGESLWSPEEFKRILIQDLPVMKQQGWWPFNADLTKHNFITCVTTPYFNHFKPADIQAQYPWKFMNIQGQNHTIYVHASTCFESIYDCWAYANLIFQNTQVATALPTSRNSPLVIIGAGASGLLFALKLKRLGYSNITLLESTDRYGGKTHTIVQNGPYPSEEDQVPTFCELGACYLSPSYDLMVADLTDYLVDNYRVDFTLGNKNFRGVYTVGQLTNMPNPPAIMNYSAYVVEKAKSEVDPNSSDQVIESILAENLAAYSYLYYTIMGNTPPMPSSPPQDFLDKHGAHSFADFLNYYELGALIGMLQYGYQVQGYGSLDSISAFYGLVWITPQIMLSILYDSIAAVVNLPLIPVVTAFSKGWGDLWDQIVRKEELNPQLNVKVISIQRATQYA